VFHTVPKGAQKCKATIFRPKFEQRSATTLKWYKLGWQLVLIIIIITLLKSGNKAHKQETYKQTDSISKRKKAIQDVQ